jgi:C4-dicarboxylate transporter DctM subunit
MALPVIIIGGIYSGIFTPTEAAAVAVAYSAVVAFGIKRIPLSKLKSICLQTLKTTSMIFFIIIGALIFGHVVTMLQVPQKIITFLGQAGISPLMFIVVIGIIFIFLGDFLEVVSITLITLPLIYPILLELGIDPIWFAVIMCINMEFALITPPVGLNLFVINGIIKDANLLEVFKGTLPFMILMLLTLLIVIAFPVLSTWLPGTVH